MESKNQNKNKRSRMTGKLELRKLWYVPDGKYIYALAVEVETQTAPTPEKGQEPDFDSKDTISEKGWSVPQGYTGDEDWAKRTAEHFDIAFPEEEWKEPKEA